jgi:DNA-binding phage protein
VIQLAITLVTTAGVSFRAVSKIYIHLNLYLRLNLDIPTHTTVLNWTKKQGVSQFRDKEFFQHEKWVLIVDESIQFGNKKLLVVFAVPEHRCSQSKSLSYKDLTPLVLKVSASWKSDNIVSALREHIDPEQISYCVSDTGGNLTCAFNALKCKHIPDINHKFSLMMQSLFENDVHFIEYTKALSSLRAQKSMSKMARIVPPNQRIMSRWMNLTPLLEWGMKMIHLLDKTELTEDEKTVLSFLKPLKEFLFDIYQILVRLNDIQKLLKNKGFNDENLQKAISKFSDMKSNNSLKIKRQVENYFDELTSKAEGKTICCSSDIIESCFGRYKEIVKGNKSFGISDLCLCIAAMTGKNNANNAMETVSIKQLKEWKTKNISKTLFAEKTELNKKVDRSYFMKM